MTPAQSIGPRRLIKSFRKYLPSVGPIARHRKYAVLFSEPYYTATYPECTAGGQDPLTHYCKTGWRKGYRPHPLFDPAEYCRRYPDVAASDEEPLAHYIDHGWKEHRNPHPLFDVAYYLRENPDVAACQVEPLRHYLQYGSAEGRAPHPLFSPSYYRQAHPDLAFDEGAEPLTHYLTQGWRDGRAPHPLFDPTYYQEQHPRLHLPETDPLQHYIDQGWRAGRHPHPLFDTFLYKHFYADVEQAQMDPLRHYIEYGWREGRCPHILFDPHYYQIQNPDLDCNPLIHYIETGENANRRPNAFFSPLYYRNSIQAGQITGSALVHFYDQGDGAGVRPSPEFDPVFYRGAYLGFETETRALTHYFSEGQYRGYRPRRMGGPSFRAADWLAWRKEHYSATQLKTAQAGPEDLGTSLACLWVGAFADNTETRHLRAEMAKVAGVAPLAQGGSGAKGGSKAGSTAGSQDAPDLLAFSDTPAVAAVLSALERTDADYICMLRPGVLLAAQDIERLVLSLKNTGDPANPSSEISGVVPLFAAGDLLCASLTGGEQALSDWDHKGLMDVDHPVANTRWTYDAIDAPALLLRRADLIQTLKKSRKTKFDPADLAAQMARVLKKPVAVAPGAVARIHESVDLKVALRLPDRKARRLLYIDSTVPRPNMDAGSDTAWRVLNLMRGFGFEITFLPTTVSDTDRAYVQMLQDIGVTVMYPPFVTDLFAFIAKTQVDYDVVFVCRAPIAGPMVADIRSRWPQSRVIFNTVDLHYLRAEREAEVLDDPEVAAQVAEIKAMEFAAIAAADETIVLSEIEYDILKAEQAQGTITVVPPVYDIGQAYPYVPQDRHGVFFVGGFAHSPNVDAVQFLITDVWPKITAKRPDIKLYIAGSNMPDRFHDFASDQIEPVGFVPDLDGFMADKRVMVSPLRYGAGIKVKVIASISAGVPAVVTPTSVEGAGLAEGQGFVTAETADQIAASILALYDDLPRLSDLSAQGVTAVRARFSLEANRQLYARLLQV